MNAAKLRQILIVSQLMEGIVDTKHDRWIGREVDYVSGSGRHYVAIVHAIPENPDHGYTDLPTVTLSFENCDRPGKSIKKRRVLPRQESWVRGTWAPLEGFSHNW